jgi:hypothetical protein
MTRRKCALALSLGLLLVGDAPLASAAPMFSGLGDLSSGGFSSLASAISGDGVTVVGESSSALARSSGTRPAACARSSRSCCCAA